jgi:hypothetical protein
MSARPNLSTPSLSDAAESPALIKLDVEGSELAILEGSDDLLRSTKAPIWLIEVNYQTTRALGYRPMDLRARLHRFGDYQGIPSRGRSGRS